MRSYRVIDTQLTPFQYPPINMAIALQKDFCEKLKRKYTFALDRRLRRCYYESSQLIYNVAERKVVPCEAYLYNFLVLVVLIQ